MKKLYKKNHPQAGVTGTAYVMLAIALLVGLTVFSGTTSRSAAHTVRIDKLTTQIHTEAITIKNAIETCFFMSQESSGSMIDKYPYDGGILIDDLTSDPDDFAPASGSAEYRMILVENLACKNGPGANDNARLWEGGLLAPMQRENLQKWYYVQRRNTVSSPYGDEIYLVLSDTKSSKEVYQSFKHAAARFGGVDQAMAIYSSAAIPPPPGQLTEDQIESTLAFAEDEAYPAKLIILVERY